MLWTLYEEDSEDEADSYIGPPPGDLDSFYAFASRAQTQESEPAESSRTVAPISNAESNIKKEMNEKHIVEEMVVPADDDEVDHQPDDANSGQSVEFPDGGLRAWLVVLGTFFSAFASFGYVNAWGVFQAYYGETILREYSPSTIAWIGSIQYALILFSAVFSGYLFESGIIKLPFLGASVLLITSTFLVGQCKEYWQFLLCQGVAVGIGCGLVFNIAIGIIGQWFRKRRGLAMGFTTLGSSMGGTVFPIAVQKLIPRVGFSWTMRILGFIVLFALAIPSITLAQRLPPTRNSSGGFFNCVALKNPPFLTYAVAVGTGFLGRYTVPTYIDLGSLAVGLSPDMAAYLVAIANASSGLGRIVTRVMTDKIGALNCIIPTTLGAAALSFAWPFAKTEASLVVVAALYGFIYGSFATGILLPAYELGGVSDAGHRTGLIMSVGALGALCGTPISGAISKVTGGFEVVGYYAGSVTCISMIFLLITRQLVLKRLWGKV
ncbi:major facilitator superfamily domain-containing protein [Lentinula raphanica]|nr:major facilitator superfamily domain-containing protein [Lentinula raphanica]